MTDAYRLLRPLLFRLPPETAHRLAAKVLKAGLVAHAAPLPGLRRRLLGLDFANPVGVGAGLDKNAEAVDGWLALGFGFVEVGTVTPRPQPGNPRPRIFRLTADHALINRLGFNNEGHEAVYRRLASRPRRGIVGVNIGANKDSEDRTADYVAGVSRFAGVADYLTLNVSSPNTPGLRGLQEKAALEGLLGRVAEARAAAPRHVPLLLKIAPELDPAALGEVAEAVQRAGIDGIIATNTTLAREGLADPAAGEAGGLSGRPLFRRSTAVLATLRAIAGRRLVLVGAGGIDSPDAAAAKLAAGADLLQIHTGLVYEGPGLLARILARLAESEAVAAAGTPRNALSLPGGPDGAHEGGR